MPDLMTQLREIGHQLDAVGLTNASDKARALLRRRKELAHRMEANRAKGLSHQRRERDQRAK
jgi:hypothetical protein